MPDGASDREIAEEAIRRRAAQKRSELEFLIGLMRQRQPRTVVEIGTAHGGTLFALCQAADARAIVVSIDLPGGLFGGGYSKDEARQFRAFTRPGQRLRTLRRDSKSPWTRRRLRWLLRGRNIEFLLIDGDHTYEAVRRDWELYEPLVANGGLIAFHDIVEHPHLPTCQVDQLWSEIAPRHKTKEFVDPHDDEWGGIGVILKQGD